MNKLFSLFLLMTMSLSMNKDIAAMESDDDSAGYLSAQETDIPERPRSAPPIMDPTPQPAPSFWQGWFGGTPSTTLPLTQTGQAYIKARTAQEIAHQANGTIELAITDNAGMRRTFITEETLRTLQVNAKFVASNKATVLIQWQPRRRAAIGDEKEQPEPQTWGTWFWSWTGGIAVNAGKQATHAAVATAVDQVIDDQVLTHKIDVAFDGVFKNLEKRALPPVTNTAKWGAGIVGTGALLWIMYKVGQVDGLRASQKQAEPKPVNPYLLQKPKSYKIPDL